MKLIKVSYNNYNKLTKKWDQMTVYINPTCIQRLEITENDSCPMIYFTDEKTLYANRTHISEVLSQLEEGGKE